MYFSLGPIAGFDVPAIAATIRANPLQLVQYLIIGLANGAILAIIALGYTMVYGIIELINFAHGDVYMFGVFTSLTVLSLTGTLTSTGSGSHHPGAALRPGRFHCLLCRGQRCH